MGAPLTWLVGTTIRVKKQQEATWLAGWLAAWLDHCQPAKEGAPPGGGSQPKTMMHIPAPVMHQSHASRSSINNNEQQPGR
jgi:hypothetical protein